MTEPAPPQDTRNIVVGIGEALFDIFPEREVLGGAPLNAAVVAHQIGRAWNARGVMVSRVGKDERGEKITAECKARLEEVRYLQVDPTLSTGTVHVTVKDREPSYTIDSPAAWDALAWSTELADLAASCHGVVFGTLAQRSELSRGTIQQFIREARSAVRMFDVNLRQQYYSKEVIEASLAIANVVKMNREELGVIAGLLGWPIDQTVTGLLAGYGLKAVIVTHGERGTELVLPSQSYCAPVASFTPAENADSVGAGDACAATCLLGLIENWPSEMIVERANRIAAFVASQPGATPIIPDALLV